MKKKLFPLLLLLCLVTAFLAAPVSAAGETSGTCGTDLTYTLDGNGLLTISGTGTVIDDEAFMSRTDIRSVIYRTPSSPSAALFLRNARA